MAVDYNELLYEKLQAEYNAYIESLKQMTPEQVIENAYQKVFKEDLIIAFENANLEPLEAKALYLEKYPLSVTYPPRRMTVISPCTMIFARNSLNVEYPPKK